MVLEATGGETRANGRPIGYESRTRTGVSGVTGGLTGGGTDEGHHRGYSSIVAGRGSGTGGARETTIGGTGMGTMGTRDRDATTGGSGGVYDRGHASATSTAIPTSTVAREYVSEPGIKESNTNVESYMTVPGAGSGIGTGTITGTGTGTGSGTRMYTAGGGSSDIRGRTDENVVTRGKNLSIGKGVDHGARTYTIGDGTTATRITGDIDPSSYGRNLGSGEISRPRAGSGGLSYLKDTAASFGLGAVSHSGERSHPPGEASRVMEPGLKPYSSSGAGPRTYRTGKDPRTTEELYSKDFGSGAGPSRGPSAGMRRYTIGGDTYAIGIRRGDSSVDRTGDLTSTMEGATKITGDLSSRSPEDSRRTTLKTSARDRRASYTGTGDQPSTLSYIKDVVSNLHIGPGSGTSTGADRDERSYTSSGGTPKTGDETYATGGGTEKTTLGTLKDKAKDVASTVGIGPGSGTDTRTGKDKQTYASGDTSSTRVGDSRTFVTGGDSTLSKIGGDSRAYTTGGDTSTTKAGDTSSYIKDTGIGSVGTGTRGYDTSSGSGFDSGNTYGQGSRSYVAGGDSSMETRANTKQAPFYSKDFARSSHPTISKYTDTPSTVETRSGGYVPGYEDRGTRSTGDQDGSGKMRMERYIIIHPGKAMGDQTQAEGRMEREAGVEQQMERGHEQPGRQGTEQRYIIGGSKSMEADRRRKEVETRTMQEYGSQPSNVRDDASAKHDRIRLDLEQELYNIEQEALRIAREKGAATSTTGSGQKYSSLVSESQEPIERRRSREDMARISSRDVTPSRGKEARIPGDFDSQERYDRDVVVGKAESSARSRPRYSSQEVRGEAAATSSQAQLENPPREPIGLNLEQRQQQETREREVEKAARESSMERHRTADLARTGSGPGGMRTTMRGSPEYKEQKASDSERAAVSERGREDERGAVESRFEGDDDEVTKKGILERAADKMGHLLKT